MEGVRQSLQTNTSSAIAFAQRQIDGVVPPSTRQDAYEKMAWFAGTYPVFSALIATQCVFCFFPLFAFAGFAVLTVAFSVGAALAFSLFCTSIAFVFMVPALLVAASIAFLVFLWGASSFLVGRWVYKLLPLGQDSTEQHTMGNGIKQEE